MLEEDVVWVGPRRGMGAGVEARVPRFSCILMQSSSKVKFSTRFLLTNLVLGMKDNWLTEIPLYLRPELEWLIFQCLSTL